MFLRKPEANSVSNQRFGSGNVKEELPVGSSSFSCLLHNRLRALNSVAEQSVLLFCFLTFKLFYFD